MDVGVIELLVVWVVFIFKGLVKWCCKWVCVFHTCACKSGYVLSYVDTLGLDCGA